MLINLNVNDEKTVFFQDKSAKIYHFVWRYKIGNAANEPVKWAILTFLVFCHLFWWVKFVWTTRLRKVDKLMRQNTLTHIHSGRFDRERDREWERDRKKKQFFRSWDMMRMIYACTRGIWSKKSHINPEPLVISQIVRRNVVKTRHTDSRIFSVTLHSICHFLHAAENWNAN